MSRTTSDWLTICGPILGAASLIWWLPLLIVDKYRFDTVLMIVLACFAAILVYHTLDDTST